MSIAWYLYNYYLKKTALSPRLRRWSRVAPTIYYYVNVLYWHIGIFFSSGRGSFLVLSVPWHTGSPPEHHGVSVSPGRRPWHVLWGFKVESAHGEAFRARRAIQAPPKPTYRLKECPTAHVISRFLNVINVITQYLLGDEKAFPRHQHARHATTFNTIR